MARKPKEPEVTPEPTPAPEPVIEKKVETKAVPVKVQPNPYKG